MYCKNTKLQYHLMTNIAKNMQLQYYLMTYIAFQKYKTSISLNHEYCKNIKLQYLLMYHENNDHDNSYLFCFCVYLTHTAGLLSTDQLAV